jgi:hypothetical protein
MPPRIGDTFRTKESLHRRSSEIFNSVPPSTMGTSPPSLQVFPFLYSVLYVEDLNVPLPPIQRVADIEKLLLPMQLELLQRFGASLSTKALHSCP